MKKSLFIIFIIGALISQSCSQTNNKQNNAEYLIMFYNVENLFDTIDHPEKRDDDFTPEGRKEWTTKRFNKKINDLAKVIDAVGDKKPADLIGLAEIENRLVLEELIAHKLLRNQGYQIIHFESPDERGIDVALLYRESRVKKAFAEKIYVDFAWDKDDKTRDILYAKVLIKKEPLHIFVNHWSSRGGGREKTEPKRIKSAELLRNKIDSIKNENPNASVIVMGDLNDEPENISIKRVLYANGNKNGCNSSLYNLAWEESLKGKGTYHYWRENEWNMLDQIIVSRNLISDQNDLLSVRSKSQEIFSPKWLMYKNEDNILVPSKTFGKNYYGGYSDHLPVYIYLNVTSRN